MGFVNRAVEDVVADKRLQTIKVNHTLRDEVSWDPDVLRVREVRTQVEISKINC
jgi:hypothetical protein